MFTFWYTLGIEHILAWDGLDHILYVVALSLHFNTTQWRKLLVAITAFTVGHCITLYLTALDIISINTAWVELCIPITIAITALINICTTSKVKYLYIYLLAVFFGFIHGMAYGASAVAAFAQGADAVYYLLAFNIGVELGQIIVVAITLGIAYIVLHIAKLPLRIWQVSLSSIILVYAIYLTIKNLP